MFQRRIKPTYLNPMETKMNIVQRKTYWKKHLRALRSEWLQKKDPLYFEKRQKYYPNQKYKYDDTTNFGLRTAVMHWIKLNGGKVTWWNSTTNGLVNYKGHTVLHALINECKVVIHVEVDNEKNVQIEDHCQLYFIARNMQSFVNWYEEFNKKGGFKSKLLQTWLG